MAGRKASLLASAAVLALAAGCSVFARGGGGVTLAYLSWDESVANSFLIEAILEDSLGYEGVDLKQTGLNEAFEGVGSGRFDAFADVWMPNHRALVRSIEESAELSEEPWYTGRVEYGMAVPYYMKARSIADLNASEADMIVGIEPDAVLMERISEKVIPAYGLDLELVESSTPAMLSELDEAYRVREPIVFLAWRPHWMNEEYDFRYLKDPKNAMGSLNDPKSLHAIYHEDFKEDDPAAYALIDAMRLNEEQIGTLELQINHAGDPKQGVRNWLEDRQNRETVQPWISAAREAQE
ncbi:MAG: glycine betaine ABC transporter substrate-binding protein [Actinomycetota bacterium]